MAFVLRNCAVAIDGVLLSSSMREVAVDMSAADVSTTAMGAGGEGHLAGIRDDSFTFTAYSDVTSGGTSTLRAIVGAKFIAAGTVEVKVSPVSGAIGTANPMYIGYCPILTWNPVSGAVGDAAMTPLNLPVNGTITELTAGTLP